jgi:hypothetical protein
MFNFIYQYFIYAKNLTNYLFSFIVFIIIIIIDYKFLCLKLIFNLKFMN